ncbi:MAG: glycosyltransferase family 2 protein [Oscillospiraceae bacterium]|nr:glycosyltransferase family 2 protein [Oscillospiraceae bacterium]
MLSIVIPAYNEGETINIAADTISEILEKANVDYEIIFADDGSRDNTWDNICKRAARENSRIRGVRFSRNFGKEAAIFAGLEAAAKGGDESGENGCDCAVVIDCDLQHPPELILKMYELWKKGYEVVEARKSSRGRESPLYKLFAKTFYRLMKSSSGINLDGASDYKLLDRKVIDSLNELPERLTFFRALSAWVGYKTAVVEFEVQPRVHGTTKWSFSKLFKFAVSNITGFTNFPMHMMTAMGIIFMIFAVVLGIQTLVNFFSGYSVAGFSTVILLLLIIGSLLMLGLGIIGYYLSKIYEEIKFRPRYIVNESTNKATKAKKTKSTKGE